MLIIRDPQGNSAPLLVDKPKVSRKISQVAQLDFSTTDSDENHVGFAMLVPRAIITVPETHQSFRISTNNASGIGEHRQRTITALGVVHDLAEHHARDTIKGLQSLDACLQLVVRDTAITYTIHDSFDLKNFSSFGNGAGLDLLGTLATKFGFEWDADNYHLDIYKQLGTAKSFVFIAGHDITALTESADYTSITTRCHGEGKFTPKGGKEQTITADYVSPAASHYGSIDADDVSGKYDTQEKLVAALKKKVQDYPLVSYTATQNTFERASPADKLNQVNLGNQGYVRDRQDIDINVRITELVQYPQSGDPTEITFGNRRQNFTEITAQLSLNQKRMETESTAIDDGDDDTEIDIPDMSGGTSDPGTDQTNTAKDVK